MWLILLVVVKPSLLEGRDVTSPPGSEVGTPDGEARDDGTPVNGGIDTETGVLVSSAIGVLVAAVTGHTVV